MEKKVQLLPLSEEEAVVLRDLLKSIIPLLKAAKVGGFLEQTVLKISIEALESILKKITTTGGTRDGGDESGRPESCCYK